MPAVQYDIELEQGVDDTISLRWKDADQIPVDLTGYTAFMQMRASTSATDVLDELSTENGRIVLGGADGTVDLIFPHAVTAAYLFRRAKYGLELMSPLGLVTRLAEGVVTISREVARRA